MRIVVGVATVEPPDPVLLTAISLARSVGAALHVVHVVDDPTPVMIAYRSGGGPLALDPGYLDDRMQSLHERLSAQCARAAQSEPPVDVQVLAGAAHNELTAFASRVGADLLAVGATRTGRVWRSIIGTTAERVLRESPVAVLVLHRPFFRPVERVLMTTDLTELSAGVHERALDLVEALFDRSRLAVRSLVVLGYHLPPPPPLPPESVEEAGAAAIERFLGARRPRPFVVSSRVRVGEPPIEINVEADAWDADLVVLGTHGRSGLARYVFGSVAAATLRDATRNALVIPAAARSDTVGGVLAAMK